MKDCRPSRALLPLCLIANGTGASPVVFLSVLRFPTPMVPAQLIKLTRLMERTTGDAGIGIGLIDGPVSTQHPDLNAQHLREIAGSNRASCTQGGSVACLHGTFIAGILSAKRTSLAPSICPDCTLFIRPIFSETSAGREEMPAATPAELATAILDCIHAGARVINLSAALAQPSSKGDRMLDRSAQSGAKPGGADCCGGREPGDARDLRHHASSMGYPGSGLRCPRAPA